MRYWFRTALGLVLFFAAATAFDYSLFELIAEDRQDKTRFVAAIPLGVAGALGGGALYAMRGRAPWQENEPPGWAIAVPAWSFFFVTAGVVALAAALGASGAPEGITRFGGVIVGATFAGLGLAPFLLGIVGPRRQPQGGTGAKRIAAAAAHLFLALAAISTTLAVMDSLRQPGDRVIPPPPLERPPPVAGDAPGSLFREEPLGTALDQLALQAPDAWRILSLEVNPNELRAELEVETGRLLVVLDREGQALVREQLGPAPDESFEPELVDAAVCERIGKSLAAAGGPGLGEIQRMVAIGAAGNGRPGWRVFVRHGTGPPFILSIDGRRIF